MCLLKITRPWKIIRVFIQVYLRDGHIEAATDDEILYDSKTTIRQQQDMNYADMYAAQGDRL